MAALPITPTEVFDNAVDITTFTAFTVDGIEYDNPATNICLIFKNTGVGPNDVVIKKATDASTNDFDYQDRTVTLGAGEMFFVSPNNPAVSGTPTEIVVSGTATEVEYVALEIKKGF